MNNEFVIQPREIALLDEKRFLAQGGTELRFGALEGDTVRLYASGSPESISCLARNIIGHRTAAR